MPLIIQIENWHHPFYFLNCENQDIKNNNIATRFVWIWNRVSYFQGRT